MGRVGVTVIYSQLLVAVVVVVATHRDDVLVVGGEGDAVDAVLVSRKLSHAALSVLWLVNSQNKDMWLDVNPDLEVPHPDRGKMAALSRHQIPPVLGPEKLKIRDFLPDKIVSGDDNSNNIRDRWWNQ